MKIQDADVYTDFSGLAKLKTEARQNSPEALSKVASQFESIFLNMVLKSMRQAKLADGIMDSDQSKFFQDMYDQQLAVHLSASPGIGLADLIVKQLSPKQTDDVEKMGVEDYLKHSMQRRIQISPEKLQTGLKSSQRTQLTEAVNKQQNFSDKQQFIEQLLPYAKQAAQQIGVDESVLIAQAALETGWGKAVIKHEDGRSSFNLFNIKVDRSWEGGKVDKVSLEYRDGIARKQKSAFRSYQSYQESFRDYARFIKQNPRYEQALKQAGDAEQYMHELQKAGYATDPGYAKKVLRILQGNTQLAMNRGK